MSSELLPKTEAFLAELISEVSEIAREAISPEADFQEFGLDSRFVITMNSRLEQYFPGLPRTVFFEYPSIRAVAGYLVEDYGDHLRRIFGEPDLAPVEAPRAVTPTTETTVTPLGDLSDLSALAANVPLSGSPEPARAVTGSAFDIAIIGVAGRYPKARNIDEFWRNLREGRDCIEPLPKERWQSDTAGPLCWGGFLDGVADFDALFFNMAPRVAETMDPQERLFLEVAWETIESAGYDPMKLSKSSAEPAPIGVFVGVMYGEYQVLGAELTLAGQPTLVSSSYASIPNRVSYFLNFCGPSIALDTMCSSSLTALHLACASLRDGECKMAVVGGTNVTIHPNKYRLLEAGKYLASDGRCRSYGADGDGYVPSEGVGAVLLKPLADALRDGDTVWGVIKGTSINHGGRARGYTTPNPSAQAAAMARALERANVEPQTLGYIEGHGTGTSLGDPIEIRGIQKALGPLAEKVAIGSVKSNIGHAESAAGVAGVTKVLLQMRAGELAPSIHCEPPNPNIDFERAPIMVQRTVSPWQRKKIGTREVPRRAVVSAFGAGGSNAQIVLEEAEQRGLARTITPGPRMFVLSARSKDRLREHAQRFLDLLSRQPQRTEAEATEWFYDLCATLHIGRTTFETRLAIVADGVRALQQKLAAFVHGVTKDPAIVSSDTAAVEAAAQPLVETARRWVAGEIIDTGALYPQPWKKLALPTYPFERRRLWPMAKLYDLTPAAPSAAATASLTELVKEAEAPPPAPARLAPPPPRPVTNAHSVVVLETAPPAVVETADDLDTRARRVEDTLRALVANLLGIDPSEIRTDAPLFDYGLESVAAVELAERVNAMLGLEITPTIFFEFKTLAQFSRHLAERYDLSGRLGGVVPASAAPPAPKRPVETAAADPLSIEELWKRAAAGEKKEDGIALAEATGEGGRRVEWAAIGTGAPVIVLGGLLATHESLTLNPDILSLAESHRVVMVHPPGAGRSELPSGELTMDFVVSQIEHVRRALALEGVAVVGYSFGGIVAQAYVARFPERVSKVVLACTTSEPSRVTQSMHLVAAEAERHPDALRALQFADLAKFPLYASLSTKIRTETLAYPDLPTLIIAGGADLYVPAAHAVELARGRSNAKVEVVESAGHFLALSHGDVMVSLIARFLEPSAAITMRTPPRRGLVEASAESLAALKCYLEEGEISSGADISPVVAQVGLLVNRILAPSRDACDESPFNCFFLPSGIEAVDAALRYGRRRAKLAKRPGQPKTVVLDTDGRLRQHFEFLPGERLFPDLEIVVEPAEVLRLVKTDAEVATVYVTTECADVFLETMGRECAARGIVYVLAEAFADSGTLATPRLATKPDVVVFDEGVSGFEVSVGVCAVRRLHENGVWTRQPEEFTVRLPGSMTGPALVVVRESILRRHRDVVTSELTSELRSLVADQAKTKAAFRRFVNPALLDSLEAFGLAVRQRHADRSGYEIERDDRSSAHVSNLYLITSASFRGHTGTEVAKTFVAAHDPKKRYSDELARRASAKLGFDRVFPAASPATAVESALKLALLAAKKGSSLLVLEGSPLFTRVGSLVSRVSAGSPLAALVETCPWSRIITVNPFAADAAEAIERHLASGDVGVVWLETLQSDWGALEAVPHAVLEAIERHRTSRGYLVGVDETYTSIGCGRLFHWETKLSRPDLVAVCVGWTDCQLVGGWVLAKEHVAQRAKERSPEVVSWLETEFRSELTAHATSRFLDVLEEESVFAKIESTSRRFSAALGDLARDNKLVARVWGEGLFWAIQLDLEGSPRFLRDWFSSFVWSECLRDPVAPVALSMQPLTPACIRVEPRCDMPDEEMHAALATLRRVLDKGVRGIVTSVAGDLERRGDKRRADLFRKVQEGFAS